MIETVNYKGTNRRIMSYPKVNGGPLLVVLHSAYTTVEKMAALISPEKFAGYNVILPEATPPVVPRWDDSPIFPRGVDDTGFISFAVVRAITQMEADPQRIFLAGFSNGSFMITRLLHETLPFSVCAVAQVSGAVLNVYAKDPWICHPVPTFLINGTADPNVTYTGSYGVMSAEQSAEYFAARLGVAKTAMAEPLPNPVADGTTVSRDVWGHAGSSKVELWTIQNGGHTWPGSTKNVATGGKVCMDFDATVAIKNFFDVVP